MNPHQLVLGISNNFMNYQSHKKVRNTLDNQPMEMWHNLWWTLCAHFYGTQLGSPHISQLLLLGWFRKVQWEHVQSAPQEEAPPIGGKGEAFGPT